MAIVKPTPHMNFSNKKSFPVRFTTYSYPGRPTSNRSRALPEQIFTAAVLPLGRFRMCVDLLGDTPCRLRRLRRRRSHVRAGRCHDPQGRLEAAKYDTYDMDLRMILFALFCFDLHFGYVEQVYIYTYILYS